MKKTICFAIGLVSLDFAHLVRNALTKVSGSRRITGATVGSQAIGVHDLGYVSRQTGVTIICAGHSMANIVPRRVVAILDRVVTTVASDARVAAVDKALSTNRLDSIVSPISDATPMDVLNVRAPRVRAFTDGGFVETGSEISMHSQNTAAASSQPPLKLDSTQPTDDLPLTHVESIRVLPGQSSASVYGSNAEDGIVAAQTEKAAEGAGRSRIQRALTSTEVWLSIIASVLVIVAALVGFLQLRSASGEITPATDVSTVINEVQSAHLAGADAVRRYYRDWSVFARGRILSLRQEDGDRLRVDMTLRGTDYTGSFTVKRLPRIPVPHAGRRIRVEGTIAHIGDRHIEFIVTDDSVVEVPWWLWWK